MSSIHFCLGPLRSISAGLGMVCFFKTVFAESAFARSAFNLATTRFRESWTAFWTAILSLGNAAKLSEPLPLVGLPLLQENVSIKTAASGRYFFIYIVLIWEVCTGVHS